MARALAVSVIAFAVVMVWISPEATADPPPGTTVFTIGKCFDPGQPAQQRPVRFDYDCNNTGVMEDMTWTSWGVDGAEGSGTDSSIECQPNCAQGSRLTNPILVHAWNPLQPTGRKCPAGAVWIWMSQRSAANPASRASGQGIQEPLRISACASRALS